MFNIPLVLEINDATVIKRSRPLILKRTATFLESLILRKPFKIVTISDYLKELLINKYNIKEETIIVMPNGIDPERFRKNSCLNITRTSIAKNNKVIIGFLKD